MHNEYMIVKQIPDYKDIDGQIQTTGKRRERMHNATFTGYSDLIENRITKIVKTHA